MLERVDCRSFSSEEIFSTVALAASTCNVTESETLLMPGLADDSQLDLQRRQWQR
jgi:hypothetical protein